MRVVFLIYSLRRGGAERQLVSLVRNLSREERSKKFEESAAANAKAVGEILKPDQTKRLKQIVLQRQGAYS